MPTQGEYKPAFRKWTPAVERGIRYALAQLMFDAQHTPLDADGKPITCGISNDDLFAAHDWLRHQFESHRKDQQAT